MPNFIIYTDRLLPASETFIPGPAEALPNFTPYYVGARRVDGLDLPDERVFTAHSAGAFGKAQQYAKMFLTGNNGVAALAPKLRPLYPLFIQAHYGPSGANAIPLAKALKIPLVVYFHGIDATMTDEFARGSFYTRLYLKKRPRLIREADLFITHTEFLKQQLIKKGFPPERIVVHYIGLEIPQIEPLPLAERENIVLFVARLVEKKGCEFLIRAMHRVQETRPDVELVVVGDGDLRPELEVLAEKLLGKYRFVGWQKPHEVFGWMSRARVFSVPSITAASGDSEGFGMVFAEAQAVGTPVASTQHGGIPEAVAHGETGFLAPERDSEILADYILQLVEDDDLWQQFSDCGPQHIVDSFGMAQQARRLEEIYTERVLK